MIVDVHYHLITQITAEIVETFNALAERWAGIQKTRDNVLSTLQDYVDDPRGDKLIHRMDQSGIDVTLINVVDNVDRGLSDAQILERHRFCARLVAQHPSRLIGLAGIDPRRQRAPILLRQCFEEYGMQGLKWHPDYGYYPNDGAAYAVLDVLNDFKAPLLTHCGPWQHTKYAHPIHLDDVALKYPHLSIIAAHLGNLLWRDWAAIARLRPNLYGDLSMWQFLAAGQNYLFRRYLREIIDLVGSQQLMFGTDGPIFEPYITHHQWVEMMCSL